MSGEQSTSSSGQPQMTLQDAFQALATGNATPEIQSFAASEVTRLQTQVTHLTTECLTAQSVIQGNEETYLALEEKFNRLDSRYQELLQDDKIARKASLIGEKQRGQTPPMFQNINLEDEDGMEIETSTSKPAYQPSGNKRGLEILPTPSL
jgi:hypothetical protein